jgi:hypothetical protein
MWLKIKLTYINLIIFMEKMLKRNHLSMFDFKTLMQNARTLLVLDVNTYNFNKNVRIRI